jgi:hypothetical protein
LKRICAASTSRLVEYVGGHDQRHVAERLREVAELAPGAGVVLLRQETEVVSEREQALEELARFLQTSREVKGANTRVWAAALWC